MYRTPSKLPGDTEYYHIEYVRYAGEFLCSVIGGRDRAMAIKSEISQYLRHNLKLELNEEKTLVTNMAAKQAHFLGYGIAKTMNNTIRRKDSTGRVRRSINGRIQLLVPREAITKKISLFTEHDKVMPFRSRIKLNLLEIIKRFNSEIRWLYNYYRHAVNVSKRLCMYKYYHYGSPLKTVAGKERCSIPEVRRRHGIPVKRRDGTGVRNTLGVTYRTKAGEEKL